jgi:lysophospholipase L1-like esterase
MVSKPLNDILIALGCAIPSDVPTASDIESAVRFNDLKRRRALRRWWYALGDRESNPADVVFLGDSISEGYQLLHSQAWWPKVRDSLRSNYPTAGVVGGRGYYSPSQGITTPADWPVARSGGSNSATQGLGLKSWALSTGNTLTLTTGLVTSVSLRYYKNGASGSFSWKVDGGSATTVSANGATSDFNETVITGLGGTAHTIVITGVSGLVLFDGFFEMNGDETKGVRVWESARSSITAAAFAGNATWYDAFTAIQPDLVLIELGANDAFGVNPPNSAATYKAAILSIISSIRTKTTIAPSIVLCPVWSISPQVGVTPIGTWNDYVAALYEIAAADEAICVCDVRQFFRTSLTVDTAGGLLGDTAHPGVQGSKVYAEAVLDFIRI